MPAPYRYIIPLPGESYGDVAASTDISEWVQPDDREVGAAQMGYNSTAETYETPSPYYIDLYDIVADPPPPDEEYPDDLSALVNTMLEDFAGRTKFPYTGPGSMGGEAAFRHTAWGLTSSPFPGDDDPTAYDHVLAGQTNSNAYIMCVDTSQSYFETGWAPAAPVGAIGYEVEQYEVAPGYWAALADPVSLDLTIGTFPEALSGSTPAFVRLVANNNWMIVGAEDTGAIDITPAGIVVDGYEPSSIAGNSLHGLAEFPLGYIASTTFTITDFVEPYIGVVAVEWAFVIDAGSTSLVGVDGQLTLASNVTPSGVYTVRPPRIRWIYDTPQTTPYRRVFPRDDALAGGAGRNWPPSKAHQSGNRTSGGFL